MIMPQDRTRIALRDLKLCPMTPIFFDTFFNLEKYLDHEQRDPFASQRELDEDGNEVNMILYMLYKTESFKSKSYVINLWSIKFLRLIFGHE